MWVVLGGVVSWSQDVGSASVVMMFSFFGFCVACARDVGCWFLFVLCSLAVFLSG